MSITNQQAMLKLLDLQSKQKSASEALNTYYAGAFYGAAGAYMLADVITFEQYQQLTGMLEEQT